jgi:hypothetical protein
MWLGREVCCSVLYQKITKKEDKKGANFWNGYKSAGNWKFPTVSTFNLKCEPLNIKEQNFFMVMILWTKETRNLQDFTNSSRVLIGELRSQ